MVLSMTNVDDIDFEEASLYASSPELHPERLLREGTLEDTLEDDEPIVEEVTTPVIDLYEAGGTLEHATDNDRKATLLAANGGDLLLPELSDVFSPFSESRFSASAAAAAFQALDGPEAFSPRFEYRSSSDEVTMRGAGGANGGGESDETYPSNEDPTFPLTGDLFSSPLAKEFEDGKEGNKVYTGLLH